VSLAGSGRFSLRAGTDQLHDLDEETAPLSPRRAFVQYLGVGIQMPFKGVGSVILDTGVHERADPPRCITASGHDLEF
jgi:hypothetical protein